MVETVGPSGAAEALTAELRALRDANDVGLRRLSDMTHLGRSTLSDTFSGKYLPRWHNIEAIVGALGGDIERYRLLWERASAERQGRFVDGKVAESLGMGPVQCFLSFSPIDEKNLEVVDALAESIEYLASANYGRSLVVTRGRAAIEEAIPWRESMADTLSSVSVFAPIITANYLQSASCREEFLLFYSRTQGTDKVPIVPLVLFGHAALVTDSPDLVAHIMAGLQWVDLRELYFMRPNSPEWRRVMFVLVERLIRVVEAGEEEGVELLQKGEVADEVRRDTASMRQIIYPLEELAELFDAYSVKLADFQHVVTEYVPRITRGREVLADVLPRFVDEVRIISKGLVSDASRIESEVVQLDNKLQSWRYLAAEDVDGKRYPGDIGRITARVIENADGLNRQEEIVATLLHELMPIELASYALRRVLRPLRRSVGSIGGGLKIVKSWAWLV